MNDYTIYENKLAALIKLNQIEQEPGKLNVIKYRKDGGGIDFLFAIGKNNGIGPEYYSMVQEHEETVVISIGTTPLDVSRLKHKELALCYCDPEGGLDLKWHLLKGIQTGNTWNRRFIELTEPGIYRNLEDGFRWFFFNGVLKREDDFISQSDTINLVTQNIEYFQRPTLEITLDLPEDTENDGLNYYLSEDTEYIEEPKFSIRVINYRGEDETSEYTIGLDNPEIHIEYLPDEGKYMVWGYWTGDFELPIQATRNSVTTTETIKVWFPEISYYGSCIVSDIDQSVIIRSVEPKLIYHDLERLDLEFTLGHTVQSTNTLEPERSILIIPHGFQQFSHIYDRNGLDYIQDYTYLQNYEYLETLYQAYFKNEPVIQNKLEQRFTNLEEYIDIPNSNWLRELDREDYYTKEQIDLMFSQYPMIRIDGNKLIVGDRTFRLEPWIDVADYYVGLAGMTREVFYSKTIDQLLSGATPYMVQNNPSYAKEYTNDDAGLVIFYVILKSNVRIDSGNLRSGNVTTDYTQADFNDPTYFDLRYGGVAINGAAYNVIGVRGVSLPDPNNMITLNFIKY